MDSITTTDCQPTPPYNRLPAVLRNRTFREGTVIVARYLEMPLDDRDDLLRSLAALGIDQEINPKNQLVVYGIK